jgi:hypothetical protein
MMRSTGDARLPFRACFDSLDDPNFMEELLIIVWTVRRIGCWIVGG